MVRISNASKRGLHRSRSDSRIPWFFGVLAVCFVLMVWWAARIHNNQHTPLTNGGKQASSMASHRLSSSYDGSSSRTKPQVAYVVSVTGCGSDPITEGAAVLKHSIHKASEKGAYGYKMYAIVHPSALSCGKTVEELGYEILERNTLVAVDEIRGDFLREAIVKDG